MGIKVDTNRFIERARKVHGDKYDHSKVEYIDAHTKVCIICPIHGEFWQIPNAHLRGQGCPKCGKEHMRIHQMNNLAKTIEKAKLLHNNKYDYSQVVYDGCKKKVCIICPYHGEFWQTLDNHINNHQGCPKCSKYNVRYNNNKFAEIGNQIHKNKYDYSKVEYINNHTEVCIICPIHGEFWQIPYVHIKQGCGCPKCTTKKLENEIALFLTENNINFIQEYKQDWLKLQRLDFYLPQYNVAIECQGLQHFKSIDFYGGEEDYKKRLERDERKRKLCEENGVKLLYYSNLGIKYPYKVFENKDELLKNILT